MGIHSNILAWKISRTWGCKESDATEQPPLHFTSIQCLSFLPRPVINSAYYTNLHLTIEATSYHLHSAFPNIKDHIVHAAQRLLSCQSFCHSCLLCQEKLCLSIKILLEILVDTDKLIISFIWEFKKKKENYEKKKKF